MKIDVAVVMIVVVVVIRGSGWPGSGSIEAILCPVWRLTTGGNCYYHDLFILGLEKRTLGIIGMQSIHVKRIDRFRYELRASKGKKRTCIIRFILDLKAIPITQRREFCDVIY